MHMNYEMDVAKGVTYLPELVSKDHKGLWIFGEAETKRRVIMIEKKNGSYGFTLQSYGVRYKHGNRETDFITYVNAVEQNGAAYYSGLREGDVILSINGQNMARVEHKSLVNFIRKCPTHLKMVVVSDERARKVELHMKYVHLQKKLQDKIKELEHLNRKEKDILSGAHRKQCAAAGAACIPNGNSSSACCFCPQKVSCGGGFPLNKDMDEKEKSKTISAITSAEMEKDLALFYESYRKSQSNRELNASGTGPSETGESSVSKNEPPPAAQGCSSDSPCKSQNQPHHPHHFHHHRLQQHSSSSTCPAHPQPAFQNTTVNRSLDMPISATARLRCTSPLIRPAVMATTSAAMASGGGGAAAAAGVHRKPPTGLTSNSAPTSKPPSSSSSSSTASSTAGGPENGALAQTKPKSWDNLMATKSFGGYGFGFGYGYFPSKTQSPGNHPTHPHHHNHHIHCNHAHSSYYYNSVGAKSGTVVGGGGSGSGLAKGSYAEYRHCHVTPFSNSGAYQVVTVGKTIRPGAYENSNPGSSKTLPVMRGSCSGSGAAIGGGGGKASKSSEGMQRVPIAKMERTLSDSSLNSETHKDFPKTMSCHRYQSDEDETPMAHNDKTNKEQAGKKHNIYV